VSRLEASVAKLEKRLAAVEAELAGIEATTSRAAQAQPGRQPSAPSESEGKKFLDDLSAPLHCYRVKSFTKTNAKSDEHNYTMEYEAELECLQTIDFFGYGNPLGIRCQKGQIVKKKGEIPFEKTENGWRIRRY
jgi:hypothetical protein